MPSRAAHCSVPGPSPLCSRWKPSPFPSHFPKASTPSFPAQNGLPNQPPFSPAPVSSLLRDQGSGLGRMHLRAFILGSVSAPSGKGEKGPQNQGGGRKAGREQRRGRKGRVGKGRVGKGRGGEEGKGKTEEGRGGERRRERGGELLGSKETLPNTTLPHALLCHCFLLSEHLWYIKSSSPQPFPLRRHQDHAHFTVRTLEPGWGAEGGCDLADTTHQVGSRDRATTQLSDIPLL